MRAYRMWDKDLKKMHKVTLIDFKNDEVIDENGDIHKFSDIELMQFTGLYDKNGKEIYEGDIVFIDTYSYEEPEFDGEFRVVYDETKGIWLLLDLENDGNFYTFEDICGYYKTGLKIIGNIYENSDLLGE